MVDKELKKLIAKDLKAKPKTVSALIRSFPTTASLDEIQARARALGLPAPSARRVYKVRWTDAHGAAGAKSGAKSSTPKGARAKSEKPAKAKTAKGDKRGRKSATKSAGAAPDAAPPKSPAADAKGGAKTATPVRATSVRPPAASIAAFRQAVLDIGLACAAELLERYKAENAIV